MRIKPAVTRLLLAVAAAGVRLPAAAQNLPDPIAMTTDPADKAVLPELARVIGAGKPDRAALDALLVRLPRPTPLRGMVQAMRAETIYYDDESGAASAIEEALRLLPDDPRPKMIATHIFTFNGAPQRAADVWLQASRIAPWLARKSDRYVMDALVGRLVDAGDRARADRVSARLGEIGYSLGLAPARSGAALAKVREAIRAGDEAAALQGVTAISDPSQQLSLYLDRRYASLWPRIAEWSGSDLAQQQVRYLEELRSDWQATDDIETAVPYARQLLSLRAYDAVVALFLPLLDKVTPGDPAPATEFLTSIVSRALYVLERREEAKALLARVDAAFTDRANARSLNFEGGYVSLPSMDANWGEVLTHADVFLARAKTMGYSVNSSATATVQGYRACALSRTGRAEEAQQASNEIMRVARQMPSVALNLVICRGEIDEGRKLLVSLLSDEATRDTALRYVQPFTVERDTAWSKLTTPTRKALAAAPEVRAAAEKVGRILPMPLLETLPPGFDPYRLPPAQRGGGATS